MRTPSPVALALGRQRMEGRLAFAFVRSTLARGRRASPESWKSHLPSGLPLIQLSLEAGDGRKPYHPLLGLIRDKALLLSPAAREALLASIPLHRRHRVLMRDWLSTGTAERDDDIFRPSAEFDYERSRLFQSLAALIDKLWEGTDLALVMENFENAGAPLAIFLLWMIRQGCRGRLSFICSFSGQDGLSPHWPLPFRQEFFQELERRDLILYRPIALRPWRFPPQIPPTAACALREINLARAFLAWEGMEDCDAINGLAPEEAMRARAALGQVLMLSGDPGKALPLLQGALEASRRMGDGRQAARMEAALAICHDRAGDKPERDRWLERALRTLGDADDPELALHLDYVRCRIQNSFTADPANATLIRTLEERLERKGREELLLGLRSMIPYYEGVMSQRGWDEACAEARASLARAEAHDSAYLVSTLHNILGYLYQLRGRGDEAMGHFDQCISIRRSLGAREGLVQAYNGAGFLAFILGRFPAAMEYFASSLEILSSRAAYSESCLTLFNIAWICFFAGSLEASADIMSRVFSAMADLDLNHLPYHRCRDLHSFAGVTAFLLGRRSQALEHLGAARSWAEHADDGFMAPLLESLVAGLEGRKEDAGTAFHRAQALADRDGRGCLRAFLDILRATEAARAGDMAKAEPAFDHGRKALGSSFAELRSLLEHLASGGNWKNFQPILLPNDQLRFLIARLVSGTGQEACNRRIRRRLDNIAFLREFAGALDACKGERALIKAAVSLVLRDFRISSVCILENRFAPAIVESQPPMEQPKASWTWGRLFGMGEASGMRALSLPEGSLLAWPFHYRSEAGYWAVLSSEGSALHPSGDDAQVIAIALERLDLALELDRAGRSLRDALARDPLTGALSRAEFLERVERERQRHERYAGGDSAGFALILMDLDGFRKINEAFGQSGGDYLLKAVARIALLSIRELDSLGRWEADRFMVLLPCTGVEGALLAAGRILAALQAAEGLGRELGALLGRELPGDWRPLCSFGAAAWDREGTPSVEALLEAANGALRTAKAAGGATVRPGM